ncbi:RsbT co-antagonist protein RsbRA [Halalkalibacterium halodurans]|uniref:RsbT co-antagonist protein RsbRA n=1 Tax=Halalkalibacterium halodurans TaxID=86665 RepID=A0A0M0KE08_ALKHA|nr:RsbT co-antagonist protein RsbRA [Halalkalibacterium halodurans]MED3645878.1 RsbT co-antagonist protein RsbRA [Halalkalibacterium halodurans]MED4161596.1 RsbT co-antagonist protein RsbRA [Halalkalibacterium halodurans]TES54443.1 STAS domain-containing protein [Halalkalibacterium halodurans]TPE69829.1 STAS domain-containing protein [Halalkalibacterium halodurans]
MESFIVSFVNEKKDELVKQWESELHEIRSEIYLDKISDDLFLRTSQEFMEHTFAAIQTSQQEAGERLAPFTERLIQGGWPLIYFTKGLQAFRRTVLAVLAEEKDLQQVLKYFYEVEEWVDRMVNELVHDYTGSWEDTIEMQKLSLLELSAPLMPVFEGVTVMPLIGTIDTQRAKLIMENLLDGVIKHRSQVVLIDITGVPVVDTMVAHHIIQAAEAVRLVGAQCILVGIRPEIAQTIVNLGINLQQFPTKSTLQKGIEAALEQLGKKMVDK